MTKQAVDAVLKLSKEILRIEEQEKRLRARKEEKKAALSRLLAGEGPADPRSDRSATLSARVLDFIVQRYPSTVTVDDISSAMGADQNTVRTILSRLKAPGQIENPNRGEYRARKAPVAKEGEE